RWRERSLPVQILVEIPPYGIPFLDQRDLPPARPVLEVLLTLDRLAHVRMLLVPDEHPHPVPPREPVRPAVPMLPRTAPKIAGDADIERAVPPVRHHVGEVGRHGLSLRRRCNAPILSPSPRHRTTGCPGQARHDKRRNNRFIFADLLPRPPSCHRWA